MNEAAVLAVGLVVIGMAVVLWLYNQSEKMGINARPWRMFWTIFLIFAAFGVYWILVQNK